MPDVQLPFLDHPVGPVVAIAFGIVLLIAGRRLFWLAVGLSGFVAGFFVADRLLHLQPVWLSIAVAVCVGIVGAFVAVFLQRLMVGVAGFVAGGWLAIELWRLAGQGTGGLAWIFFFLGGIAAAILAMLLFEFALMAVTSLAGAILIVDAAKVGEPAALILIATLAAAGTLIQATFRRKRRRD